MPFYHPVSNESDAHCGLQFQYGSNETNISELFDSVINWGEISGEGSISQKPTSTILNPRDNGSGSDSDVEMANIPVNSHLYLCIGHFRFLHQINMC